VICCNKPSTTEPEEIIPSPRDKDSLNLDISIEDDWFVAKKIDNADETKVVNHAIEIEVPQHRDSTDNYNSSGITSRVEKVRRLRKMEGELDITDSKQLSEFFSADNYPEAKSLPSLGVNRYFTVHIENDIFSNRDWYYTNGVRFEYTAPAISKSPISYILLPYKKGSINYHGIAFGQNIFTPLNPDNEQIPYGDRPFSAYMYFGQFKITNNLTTNYRQISEFNIGIIGPASLGGYFLRSVHGAPLGGWDYQVSNDIIVNYHARIEKTLLNIKFLNIDGNVDANLGTLYTNVGTGASARIGLFNKNGFNLTSPDTWNQRYPISGKFQFFIYYKIEGRLIGYDATLQGGMFNESIYSLTGNQINRMVLDQRLGLTASLSRLSINVVQVWLSPEFKGGISHKWMEVSLAVSL